MEDIILAGYKINIDGENLEAIDRDKIKGDMSTYLTDLLADIYKKPASKKYTRRVDTTEFSYFLKGLNGGTDVTCLDTKAAHNIAERLLHMEIESDKNMSKKLKSDGHLKRGSFLQFIFTDTGQRYYLGVKLEHSAFIDEDDFQKKIGMPEVGKVFKGCLVHLDTDGTPSDEVKIFDTNGATKYWWDDFLELKEIHTSALNTERAYEKSLEVLNRYKAHKQDHAILRDTFTNRFRQQNSLNFTKFVDNTLSAYEPVDPDLKRKLPKIAQSLKGLPEKSGFDTKFDLSPSSVKFKRRTFVVNEDVSIYLKEGTNERDSKIWQSEIDDVGPVIIIKSVGDSHESFKFKPIKNSEQQ